MLRERARYDETQALCDEQWEPQVCRDVQQQHAQARGELVIGEEQPQSRLV